jgi:hypothetical protein
LAYYAFILANILMETLEIVRLELINYGIGLSPFVYVGLLGGAFLHFSNGIWGRVPYWVFANLILLWTGGFVMTIVQVAGLAMEGLDRKGSKYPLSDQITDVSVIAAVYVVIAALEVVLLVCDGKRRRVESLHSGKGREVDSIGVAS